MKPEQLKDKVVDALDDIKGRDITVLDVRHLTGMTDYMVIATGTSNRQVKALADNVTETLRKDGLRPMGSEGISAAEWILVDYGDVVVHTMLPEARAFYDLERLWSGEEQADPERGAD